MLSLLIFVKEMLMKKCDTTVGTHMLYMYGKISFTIRFNSLNITIFPE